MCSKVVGPLELFSYDSVIVNLSIDSQSERRIVIEEGLCASIDAHNTQSFMTEDSLICNKVARPIRPTVPHAETT